MKDKEKPTALVRETLAALAKVGDPTALMPQQQIPMTVPAPPLALVAPVTSEAERAFLAEAKEIPSGPPKLPYIVVDHQAGAFVMPTGEVVAGSDGIYGFIIAHFSSRGWWAKPFSGDGLPPDCWSTDCVAPDENAPNRQSKLCWNCKQNVFGTSATGKGKSCREKLSLVMVNPDFGTLPVAVLQLPPSALGIWYGGQFKRGYFDALRLKYEAWPIVWNRITLGREQLKDPHVVPEFTMGGLASLDVAKGLAAIRNQYVGAIAAERARAAATRESTTGGDGNGQ